MVRTTITLDDDVAALVEERRRQGRVSLKRVINDALRDGLMHKKARPSAFKTSVVPGGRLLIGTLDNIAQALDVAEGPARK